MSILTRIFPKDQSLTVLSSIFITNIVVGKTSAMLLKNTPLGGPISDLIGLASGLCIGKLVEYSIRRRNPPNLEQMMHKIKNCKATHDLYKQAKKAVLDSFDARLSIKMRKNVPFDGCGSPNGEILISSEQSEPVALGTLIFELANMAQAEKFKNHEFKASTKQIGREEYALGKQRIEFDTEEIYCKVIKTAKNEKVDWISSLPSYRLNTLLPESIKVLYAKTTGHMNMYYDQWDRFYA